LRRTLITCAAAALAAAFTAPAAPAAKNICLGPDPTQLCPAGAAPVSSLAEAVVAADDPTFNTVYVTPGTYSSPSATGADFSARPVRIVGVGATQPVLTIAPLASYAPGTSVLRLAGPYSGADNVRIAMPASSNLTGINSAQSGQTVSHVTIDGPGVQSGTGIAVSGLTPTVSDSSITLGGSATTAVRVEDATAPRVDDVTVHSAATGVLIESSSRFMVRRLRSAAAVAVRSEDSSGAVSSGLLTAPAAPAGEVRGVAASASADHTSRVLVDNCTIVGNGGSVGVLASAAGAGADITLRANSSLFWATGTAAQRTDDGVGASAVSLAYSRHSGALGGNVESDAHTLPLAGDPGFADAATGDFHLRLDSALIDAGDPALPDGSDSPTDADGNQRVVSRSAGNIRDIGAYEVQNSRPVPRIRIVTAVPSTTAPTEFSAGGSTDAEADAMTFDWKFDGAPGGSGVTARKLLAAEGPHTVQLTATDATGAVATTSLQFNVARGFLALRLRSQNARLTRKGTFSITMSCPDSAQSDCRGRLVFRTAEKLDAKRYKKRPGWISRADYLEAARYVFSIEPGTTQRLEVRTHVTFQNVLWKHKKFAIQSELVSGTTSNAELTANRATFTIAAPGT
jgi:hypothetical protein